MKTILASETLSIPKNGMTDWIFDSDACIIMYGAVWKSFPSTSNPVCTSTSLLHFMWTHLNEQWKHTVTGLNQFPQRSLRYPFLPPIWSAHNEKKDIIYHTILSITQWTFPKKCLDFNETQIFYDFLKTAKKIIAKRSRCGLLKRDYTMIFFDHSPNNWNMVLGGKITLGLFYIQTY